MKRILHLITLLFGTLATMPQSRAEEDLANDPLWKAVQQALNEGRPQTAIERLAPIALRAKTNGDVAEQIRVVAYQIDLEASTTEGQADARLKKMQAAIASADPAMKPVMEAIQASWLWDFFQENRWRFSQRTSIEQPSQDDSDELPASFKEDDDLMTWDLPRILHAIDTQFRRSLMGAEELKQVPIDKYAKLITKGTVPVKYRPSMYDVLVHHALEFYTAAEQAGSRSSYAFDLLADSPIFDAREDFLAWQPESRDQRAPVLVATRLYQDLLKFHLDDDDPTALLDVDLARLEFGNNHAVGPEKDERYKKALERFSAQYGTHPVSASAQANLAQMLMERKEYVAAHELAKAAFEKFPDSIGGRRCYNIIQQIEAREVQVATERVWSQPYPTIDVSYRNLRKIYLRLVRFDFEEFAKSQRWQPEALDDRQQRQLIGTRPVKEWNADLPATPDYQLRLEKLPIPTDLGKGAYFLLTSHREDFLGTENLLGISEVWVSDLSLVTKTMHGDGLISGHVLVAASGTPVPGATIRAWQHDRSSGSRVSIASVQTNQDGEFQFPADNRGNMLLLASHDNDRLSSASFVHAEIHSRGRQQSTRFETTQFFTDRAIYRPGQTIRYKGIAIVYDQEADVYNVLGKRTLTVGLFDVNGQEVERLEHRSNDNGSFSGSFTAPRGRLAGAMSIRVLTGPQGQSTVRVEEYKRPRFEVELEPPVDAAKLNEIVKLAGKATAYTGANVDGATVQWRLVREVRFPPWWYWRQWWLPPMPNQSQEIARGSAQTDADGKFQIEFTAKPDSSVPKESEPTFHFTLHADVTDGTGETRSGQRSIAVGYTALSATLTTSDWLTTQKNVELTIRTASLNGEPQAASGTVKIYALQQPEKVVRPPLQPQYRPFLTKDNSSPPKDLSNPASWELGEVVFESEFVTDATGTQSLQVELAAGIYRAVLTTMDRFEQPVSAELPMEVFDLNAPNWSVKLANRLSVEKLSIAPGETFRGLWSSGYEQARALIEIEHRGKMIQKYWTEPGKTQALIELPVTEEMRGGFTVHMMMVRENRVYLESKRIDVPWSNKELEISWERFVSKLGPAQSETWTAIIKGKDAQRVAAEMVATLYDASLDTFASHQWRSGFGVFRHDYSRLSRVFGNQPKSLQQFGDGWSIAYRDIQWQYPVLDFPRGGWSDRALAFGGQRGGRERFFSRGTPMMPAPSSMAADGAPAMGGIAMEAAGESADSLAQAKSGASDEENNNQGDSTKPTDVSLDGVPVRTNLNETAFFFPHLMAGEDGVVRMEFTMPEALTRWRFMGFAHDSQLRAGLLSDSVVTSKDLMIQPNAPRFLREGDVVEFTVKVTNLSPTRQTGTAALNFLDPQSGDSVDTRLQNTSVQQPFDIPAGGTQSIAWRIHVPDGLTLMTYRAIASSGRLSDGEEGYLPVLSRRVLITESLPLPIRGKQTKEFNFQRLLESGSSDSIQHQSLTVQMASNPAWYAVLSLPYLMEYPHQCSEQIFNRLYANSLAQHIAASDPKIEQVFEQWRGTEALVSPMEKNQDLKSVLLEESPWVQQAQSESQSRRNIGILFDQNRLKDELSRALEELGQSQLPDGRWPWFPSGPPNDYITLYITTGFGRLRHLGVDIDPAMAIRSLAALDQWMSDMHARILEREKKSPARPGEPPRVHLNYTIALYLYGRSFFLPEHPVAPQHTAALNFWLEQAKKHWLNIGSLQSQAHLALALARFGDRPAAQGITLSLKERALSNEEMGTYWRSAAQAYWWYHAPIETQAAIIEAMDEVAQDAAMVEDCKVWLLKQKQTQHWKSTKATADAVYALILRGTDLLASNQLVELRLNDQLVQPQAVEAGTGFYEQRRTGSEVRPDLGNITVTKRDDGVAWGSIHWQYFEDIERVTSYTETPLQLTKELYVKRNTDSGPKLQRIGLAEDDAHAKVGDELVVRLVLRVDRDMEYVHLKDHRGSGTEPVNVLSGYRYQDGLGYYESTRDTASHFFIDYLRSGTYVFEYSTRIQLRGSYQTGMANVQCMYAPEFGSHSQSIRLEVTE